MGLPALKLDVAYQGHRVRMVGTADAPEWVAADVCAVLGLSDPSKALEAFDDDQKGTKIIRTPSGDQEMLTVTEPGMYRLISRSRKPEAKTFQRWVFHDVLPCIRREGCYPPPDAMTLAGDERAIVQTDKQTIQDAVCSALDQKVLPVLTNGFAKLNDRVDDLCERVLPRRRDITVQAQEHGLAIVREFYRNLCPCCEEMQLLDATGNKISGSVQFDHWCSRTSASEDKVWPVCVDCNQKLGEPGDVEARRPLEFAFIQFQKRREKRFPAGITRGRKDCVGQRLIWGM